MPLCPNCKSEFSRNVGEKYYCGDCGWFECVDGDWIVAVEPVVEPEPKQIEPEQPIPEQPKKSNVKEILGGLITITEID